MCFDYSPCLLLLLCSLPVCFFFGVWYCSLCLLLVRCPLFLLVVSIVVFGLLVFFVSDRVFVLENQMKTTSTNMEHRTRTRTLLFLLCSLKLCFFFGVWYWSLFLLLVRCPLFLLVVSIVVFGLIVFIVSDLVSVQKKSNEKQRARIWNK